MEAGGVMGPHHELVVPMWACLELPTKLLNERLANGPDSLILLYVIYNCTSTSIQARAFARSFCQDICTVTGDHRVDSISGIRYLFINMYHGKAHEKNKNWMVR
ncbi:hypothetical protein P8452_39429 [Trifolium repens]|nr:hypothetical protein P8452_39429 [Trifolium repens]